MNINKELLRTLLKELCEINGASGREENVREYILDKIRDKCSCTILPSGCIVAEYKGRKALEKKLMISAHMDEVGLIITGINSDGTLAFNCVGGVEADAVIGRQVMTENGIYGSVGSKAVHNMTEDERKTPPKFDGLYIDIGAKDAADARKYVQEGDPVHLNTYHQEMINGFLSARGIDDRGCAYIILEALKRAKTMGCSVGVYAATTVGEETTGRGS